MKKVMALGTMSLFGLAGLASAETLTGKLIDVNCVLMQHASRHSGQGSGSSYGQGSSSTAQSSTGSSMYGSGSASHGSSDSGCAANSSTKTFALYASGMFYTFDDKGNEKAAAAIGKQGTASRSSSMTGEASRSAGTESSQTGTSSQGESVTATVRGEPDGSRIKVDSIQVQ